MDNTIKVAVVRTDRRRGGVAEALALIAEDLGGRVQDDRNPVLIPNLDNPGDRPVAPIATRCRRPPTPSWPRGRPRSRSPDAPAVGANTAAITLPGSAIARSSGAGRPGSWTAMTGPRPTAPSAGSASRRTPLAATSRRRWPHRGAGCAGVAKTHDVFRVGLGLANLASVVHHDDRGLLGWAVHRGDFLPWQSGQRGSGSRGAEHLLSAWLGMRTIAGGMRLTGAERRRLDGGGASDELPGGAGCVRDAQDQPDRWLRGHRRRRAPARPARSAGHDHRRHRCRRG